MEVGQSIAGVTRVPHQTEQLPGFYLDSGSDPGRDGRQVRAIISQSIIANDGDRQTAAHSRVIVFRIPQIFIGNEIHHTICYSNKIRSDHGEDIRRRVAVTGCAFGKSGRLGWL
jgi:hypothetical protein